MKTQNKKAYCTPELEALNLFPKEPLTALDVADETDGDIPSVYAISGWSPWV